MVNNSVQKNMKSFSYTYRINFLKSYLLEINITEYSISIPGEKNENLLHRSEEIGSAVLLVVRFIGR